MSQQIFQHVLALLLLVKFTHHLELCPQPELQREEPQHAMEKTIDCAQ